jgi:DNA ligase 1
MKPMLAHNKEYDLKQVKFPVIGSFKLDGVRALIKDGIVLSRSLKPINNLHVQKMFKNLPEGTDGELVQGLPYGDDVMQRTTSAVNSRSGEPDVKFYVFDNFLLPGGFANRITAASFRLAENLNFDSNVILIEQRMLHNLVELLDMEQEALTAGYEGLIIRSLGGPYKFGRSTFKEGYMLKVKRFVDAEAKIVDSYELMRNENEATTNELGRTARSSKKENLVPAGVLGGFEVVGINGEFKDVQFRVGGKFKAAERAQWWKIRKTLLGSVITYKYFPISCKDKPRFPCFKSFRSLTDM